MLEEVDVIVLVLVVIGTVEADVVVVDVELVGDSVVVNVAVVINIHV